MRAQSSPAACAALLLIYPVALVASQEDGYVVEEPTDPLDITPTEMDSVCPSDHVLRTNDICNIDGESVACLKMHCCNNFNFIAGRCIPDSVDPCSLQFCEQACEVRGPQLHCTCHQGFRFDAYSYAEKRQPYCVDVDECQADNGECEQTCINDPGGYHCGCSPPLALADDGRTCITMGEPAFVNMQQEPLPLVRASSRCYANCETVTWLSKKVKQLGDQLRTTQMALKKLLEHPALKDGHQPQRLLDATVPLQGGYCRCERGPRGPAGPPGMEGPKGDTGDTGPRGSRGPKGSLDLMLLLLADVRHDIKNLEQRVFKKGELPERFNLEKAWRRQHKLEKLGVESRIEKQLMAYTEPDNNLESNVEVTPHGVTGNIEHEGESTTDWSAIKGETDAPSLTAEIEEKLKEFRFLANATKDFDDDEPDKDDEYNTY